MAPNSPQTLLSLEQFRAISGWHAWYFWQLSNPKIPLTDSSDSLVSEYTWQRTNQASRSDLRRAIATAEQKIETALRYSVATRYREDSYPIQLYGRTDWGLSGFYGNGNGSDLLNLEVGKIQRLATVSYSALIDVTVTPSDGDGDGITDTFTGTFADSTTDPALLIAAFDSDDQPDNYATEDSDNPLDWQIRPVKIKRLDPATIQISGPAWVLVKPTLYEAATPAAGYNNISTGINSSGAIDPNLLTNYVSKVAVWKKVYSDENTATLVRKVGGTETSYQVTATLLNAESGQVALGFSSYCDLPTWCGPDGFNEVRINYEAGATADFRKAQRLRYQTDWDIITARFAVAELAQVPAAQERHNPFFAYYREDLALVGNGAVNNLYRVDNDILSNRFLNTRRGAVEAWQAVKTLAQVRAINLY